MNSPQSGKPWLPRFGIAEMMLAMMIFCVMGAAGGYLRQASAKEDGSAMPAFVIFTLVSPIALVMVLSIYVNIKRWLRNNEK